VDILLIAPRFGIAIRNCKWTIEMEMQYAISETGKWKWKWKWKCEIGNVWGYKRR
jgi:hypothetical protein